MKLSDRIAHLKVLAPLTLGLWLVAGPVGASENAPIVGEITLAIGVAKVVRADGTQQPVERGGAIRAGDRIETQAGGHVHVRFVDGGRVSVRPGSRLAIENYAHVSNQPDASAIRFRLDEGVVRSITGAWGEAAKDRFRLNTPVAAIGIRGTDFVVKSDLDSTAASVYAGAIMVAPLTAACGATLGPCLNGQEKLLSEDMKGQMLQLSRQQTSPQLVPAIDLMASNRRSGGEAATASARAVEPPRADTAADNRSIVTEARVADAVTAMGGGAVAQPSQLAWGRYAWTPVLASDTLSQRYEDLAASGYEHVTGSGVFALFRERTAVPATLATADTSANFRLTNSSAQFIRYFDQQIQAAKVDSGTLSMDFARATFATQLAVSNSTIGADTVRVSGTIAPDGLLVRNQANAVFAGAVSLDGRDAAYLFEKGYAAGYLRGITLWGR